MKLRIVNYELRIINIVYFMFFALITLNSLLLTPASAAKWSGVDESVVERYAEEHGRSGVDPLINTDQGDLLLFMFLIGGLISGFAAGYYWRMLTENKCQSTELRTQNKDRRQEKKSVGV